MNPDFLDGLSPADADSAVFICRTRYLYRRQQALPHCQAEALQNDQVLRPPPMLRDESTHASQETAPQSVRPRRTPLYVGGARCRSCMDSVSICMSKSPCSNTVYPPRSGESLKLVEPESILSASEQLPNLLSSVSSYAVITLQSLVRQAVTNSQFLYGLCSSPDSLPQTNELHP